MDDIKIVVDIDEKRLDNFLSAKLDHSRSYLAKLIDDGFVLLNGAIPKKSTAVNRGDELAIHFPPEVLPDITPREIPFRIIYETANYAIIDKPAGIAVHPGAGNYDNSLVNGLLYAFDIADDDSGYRPGIVHRLDKDTSGLLLVAKNTMARWKISELFQTRAIQKYYKAVAYGAPRFIETVIDAPIGRDTTHRQRMAVVANGKEARTKVCVIEKFPNAFLADVALYTGRTHQIRVHLKHIGHPLLGDEIYGGGKVAGVFHRQALHAYRLAFRDPFTGEDVDVQAELPSDMKELIQTLKK